MTPQMIIKSKISNKRKLEIETDVTSTSICESVWDAVAQSKMKLNNFELDYWLKKYAERKFSF